MDNKIDTNIAKNKLMILYIIKKSNYTITYNQLSNFILMYDFINYFTFVEYYNELKDSNFFTNEKDNAITLSDFSEQILELLEDNIDENVKMKIDDVFTNTSLKDNNDVQIIPLEDGEYLIKLSLNELDSNFSFNFTVENINEAKKIEKNWKDKNKSLYRQLVGVINP